MVVDDQKIFVGSANLNDRSMWGCRDSELVVFMEGENDHKVIVNSNEHLVNYQVFDFRSKIFMEHFGMSREEVIDPCSNLFWYNAWNGVVRNTRFYDDVFKVYPSNLYKSWVELEKRKEKDEEYFDEEMFNKQKEAVRGHAVVYPHEFLSKEKLEKAKGKKLKLFIIPIRVLY